MLNVLQVVMCRVDKNWVPFRKNKLGPSINDVTHLGGGGSAKRRRYSISLFSKTGDKGGGMGQKSQKNGPRTLFDLSQLAQVTFIGTWIVVYNK